MNQIDKDYFNQYKPKQANDIQDVLMEDETILVRLKPNKKSIIWEALLKGLPFVLLWGLIDITVMTFIVIGSDFKEMLFFIIPFFLVHLAPVWIYIVNIVKTISGYKNLEYALTDKRVILKSGVIGIDFVCINYADIVAVNCKVGILEKMFKVGDIHIQAKSHSALLNNIEDPYFYLSKLQQIAIDMKADMSFPNDLRPDTNHGYKSSYNRFDGK